MDQEDISGLWVFEALTRGGVDVPAVRRMVPDAFEQVLRNQEEVHPDMVNLLFDACAQNCGDPNFGLRMAHLFSPEMLGPYGFVLLNAPTVGRFLELGERYYPVLYRGCEMTLSRSRGLLRLSFSSRLRRSVSARHLDEWTLGFFVDRIRSASGGTWYPPRVSMQYSRPAEVEELFEWFGPGLRFDREGASWFECEEEIMDLAMDQADDGVLELVLDLAERRLDHALRSKSFVSRARVHMMDLLRLNQDSSRALAARMAVSLSTLKRRLGDEGSSYRTLRDEAVKDAAGELLLRTDLQVGTIARKLGYSDSSAFDRAFLRLSGMTPSQFRANDRA